jgi:hypothetical protein
MSASAYLQGFSKENLLRGLVAAVIVATVTLLFVEPIIMLLDANFGPSHSLSPVMIWIACLLIWFVLITLFHAALHAFFAYLFERGESAFEAGEFERAVRYFRWFTFSHNEHYDDSGEAHRALLAALLHLKRYKEAERVTRRCEKLGFETDLEAKD